MTISYNVLLLGKFVYIVNAYASYWYVLLEINVWMWELEHKEGWVPKKWCFWTVVLEKSHENPLDYKGIKPVNPKRNQPWIFIAGLLLKLKLWYCDQLTRRSNSLEKTLMLGKIEGRSRRRWQRMRWLDSLSVQWI